MSKIGSYKNTAFSESQKFLVLDPSTSSTSLVLGSDLVAYITPQIGSVKAESTRLSAENTDYKVGEIIQTSGATVVGSLASVYLVVAGGAGDFPMLNGNDLLVLIGDDALRSQLISQAAGEGASRVSMEGGPTVEVAVTAAEVAIVNRVIRADSVAELVALTPVNSFQYEVFGYRDLSNLGGGKFIWRSAYDKAGHDGVTIIDPDRTFPTDFNNTAQVSAWLTAGTGLGCYVKEWSLSRSAYESGITDTASTSDTLMINALLQSLSLNGGRLAIMPFELSTVLNTTVEIPRGVAFDLHGSTVDFQIDGGIRAFDIKTKSQLYNGTVTVNGTNPSGGGDKQAPVSGGNQTTGAGISKAKVYDLVVNTNRSNGNGIVLFGEVTGCEVYNISIPDSTTIGRGVALEWGGSASGTGHPHNCKLYNISAGALSFGAAPGSNAFLVWLSSTFNITVQNVYADSSYGMLGVFTGDASNDYAPARYKNMIGRGITADNITCENVKLYGIRCYGKGSGSVNLLPQSVEITNPTLRADGILTNTLGILCEFTDDVRVVNPDISGMQTGIATGQEAKNLAVIGGKVWGNRASGISYGSGAGGVTGCTVNGTSVYENNQGGFSGVGGAAGIFIQNCARWEVNNCKFGALSGETQQYSVRIETTAPNGKLNNNHTLGLVAGGFAYVNSSSSDYALGTTGENNTVEAGLNGFGGAPTYQIDWLSRKQFIISGASAPASGTWQQGDKCFYSAPSPTGYVGAVFTSAGGWKGFGVVQA
jgi:hypothetical protein